MKNEERGEEFRLRSSPAEFENKAFFAQPCKRETMYLLASCLQRFFFVIFEALGELLLYPLPVTIMVKKGYKCSENMIYFVSVKLSLVSLFSSVSL